MASGFSVWITLLNIINSSSTCFSANSMIISLFLKLFLLFIIHVEVGYLCECVPPMCRHLGRPEENVRSPGTGGTGGGCEPPHVDAVSWAQVLRYSRGRSSLLSHLSIPISLLYNQTHSVVSAYHPSADGRQGWYRFHAPCYRKWCCDCLGCVSLSVVGLGVFPAHIRSRIEGS